MPTETVTTIKNIFKLVDPAMFVFSCELIYLEGKLLAKLTTFAPLFLHSFYIVDNGSWLWMK